MERAVRRRAGCYYTPAPLAARVVRRVLAPLVAGRSREEILALRVLDPACGEGVFLVEVRRYLEERAGGDAAACLCGVDVDAEALGRAREVLGPAADLRRGDALRLAWGRARFDAVVGNPPWVSFSGRQAQNLPEATRRAYAERHESFAGWPALHALFAELAVRLARSRVGLLLPARVCDLDGYGPLRAFLRRHARVEEPCLDLGERAFAGVTQPACMVVADVAAGGVPGGAAPFPLSAPAPAPFAWLPRPPPGTFADIGVHTGNCAARLLAPGGVPIREGRDIAPFRAGRPRRTLRTDLARRPGDYFRVGPVERYREVPILLRQTASRPIAALHTEPTFFRNSVLGCMGIPGVPDALVVAWLNSTVVADYHRTTVPEAGQRTFPQVKLRHLRDLPMPPWGDASPALRRLAHAVAREGRLDAAPHLDAMVTQWFGGASVVPGETAPL